MTLLRRRGTCRSNARQRLCEGTFVGRLVPLESDGGVRFWHGLVAMSGLMCGGCGAGNGAGSELVAHGLLTFSVPTLWVVGDSVGCVFWLAQGD